MSLETWKAEFYPVEAHAVPKEQAAVHSLKKWEGLRKEELERHGCESAGWRWVGEKTSRDREVLYINSTSCALCVHFGKVRSYDNCPDCPLSKVRGGVSCDSSRPDERDPPYQMLKWEGPEPMIGWLKKAVELEAGAAT